MIENNELWDAYCAEVSAKRRSPQGAMAFAFDKLAGVPAQRAPSQTIPLPLWAAEDLLRWMRRTNDRKPTLYPIGLENLLQALVSALSSTECGGEK